MPDGIAKLVGNIVIGTLDGCVVSIKIPCSLKLVGSFIKSLVFETYGKGIRRKNRE